MMFGTFLHWRFDCRSFNDVILMRPILLHWNNGTRMEN